MHKDSFPPAVRTHPLRLAPRFGLLSNPFAALFVAVAMLCSTKALAVAPTISGSPPRTVIAGSAYSFTPTAQDADGDRLTFSVYNLPPWATFNTTTGRLSGTPNMYQAGTYPTISIRVSDGTTTVLLQAFAITVYATANNTPPTISGTPATSVTVGTAYSFTPTASDADGNRLTFYIYSQPSWATFDPNTGRLSGTPTAANVGTYSGVSIRAYDGRALTILPAFTITVRAAANTPPTIAGSPATSVVAGSAYTFRPTAADVDGNPLSFSVQNLPAWASFNTTTGQLSGTPSASNVGNYTNIVVRVSDGTATTSLPAFAISVQSVANRAPTIAGAPATSVVAGSAYSFRPTAADADGNALTFSAQNLPTWASFNTTTGQLSGTPAASHVGDYINIVIRVSDGTATTSLPAFAISVRAANRAPTIAGAPATSVVAGSAYSFRPTAADADGNALTFSVQNLPVWASFNTTTGQVSGTPGATHVGDYMNIVIRVSDGSLTAALPAFTVAVRQTANGRATVTWSRPSTNTDGTALTDLAGFKVQYGTSSSNLNQQVQIANPNATSQIIENLTPGTYYFAVRAYNSSGADSDLSGIASKSVP